MSAAEWIDVRCEKHPEKIIGAVRKTSQARFFCRLCDRWIDREGRPFDSRRKVKK